MVDSRGTRVQGLDFIKLGFRISCGLGIRVNGPPISSLTWAPYSRLKLRRLGGSL